MRVEAVEADIKNARAESLGDQPGHELKLQREAIALPWHGVRTLEQLAQGFHRRQCLHLPALDERCEVVFVARSRRFGKLFQQAASGVSSSRLATVQFEAKRVLVADSDGSAPGAPAKASGERDAPRCRMGTPPA